MKQMHPDWKPSVEIMDEVAVELGAANHVHFLAISPRSMKAIFKLCCWKHALLREGA